MTVKELIHLLRRLDQNKEVSVAVNVDYAGMPCWDCRKVFDVEDKYREILIKGKIKDVSEVFDIKNIENAKDATKLFAEEMNVEDCETLLENKEKYKEILYRFLEETNLTGEQLCCVLFYIMLGGLTEEKLLKSDDCKGHNES